MAGSAHDGPSDPDAVRVRLGGLGDAAAVSALHAEQIDQGFLSLLGTKFLTRLYRRIVESSSAFLLVAVQGGEVVGFVAGSPDTGGLYREFVLRDGVRAAFDVSGRLLRNWRRALETLRYGSSEGSGEGSDVELLSIAVASEFHGQGIGTHLVEAFLARCRTDGFAAASVVVSADNPTAIRLYGQAGFREATRFELHEGTVSLLMEVSGLGGGEGRSAT